MSAVDATTRPRIGRGFRLQYEPAQGCHVLLYPEGMVKLNASAGAILSRCDGERSIEAITHDLTQAFATPVPIGDVIAFIDLAAERRWLEWT